MQIETIETAREFLLRRTRSILDSTFTALTPMPKLLVLFDPRSDEMTRLADAVADGVRSVRFAEVDVRRVGDASSGAAPGARHRVLDSTAALAAYDGIIVGAASRSASLLDSLAGSTGLLNKVGSAFTATRLGAERGDVLWSVLAPMADWGMILVPPPVTESPSDELESARQQGKRVAEVVGWVAHARSHHHHH